jgi:hypothetical protein
MPHIRYADSEEAWREYAKYPPTLLKRFAATSVAEISGGANPALALDFISTTGLQ